MTRRLVNLTKGGHRYVFAYRSGHEGEMVDEIMRVAADTDTDIDWLDAATLGLQVAGNVADECREVLSAPPPAGPGAAPPSISRRRGDSDDAKDGPCTSSNFP